jgi:hypothetical protein
MKAKNRSKLLVEMYQRGGKVWENRAIEFRRLSGLTDDGEVRRILLGQADLAEMHARRQYDCATEAEYGHLYGNDYDYR